jgi:hypothetical protein
VNDARVRPVILAVVCTALLTSCTSSGSGHAGSHEPPSVQRQFDLLASKQNGYYYPPFLREQPAAPEAQSYALKTLAELGRDPKTSMAAPQVAALRRDALAASALWGRDWLVPLRQAGATEALGRRDAEAVNKTRAKGGWYVDPALGDDTDAARLGATWAALDVLKALGQEPSDRARTVSWLRSRATAHRSLEQGAALASALHLLGEPVPATLTGLAAPRTDDFADLTPDQRADRLDGTYYYVLIQQAAGKRPQVDRKVWEPVLRDGATTLPYEQLHYLVHVLKAAGSPKSLFWPVAERLDGERLDDGSVRDPDAYLGDPDASLFVERLRRLAGWSREDTRLVGALDGDEQSGDASQDAGERLSRLALRKVASGGGGTSAEARRLCADPTVLPTSVTLQNATQWQRTTLNCTDAGAATAVPTFRRWSLDTPDGVVAAATVTVGLADSDRRDHVPTWVTADALKEWAHSPKRFTSVYDYTLVVRAYVLLGGAADAELKAAVQNGVTAYRGCPDLPDLYRVGGGDPGCDLKTTWGAWELGRRLGIPLEHLQSPESPENGK